MPNSKEIIKYAISVWLILLAVYISHTPPDHHSHDIKEHIEYTEIVAFEKRIPKPYEGFETYHPPLYYVINSFFVSFLPKTDKENHIKLVKVLSVVYGILALWVIGNLLQNINQSSFLQLLVLLFISTTPKFVFVFSSYNNDSLVTLLCILAISIAYKLYSKWSWQLAFFLLFIATAAFYTKLTAIFCICAIILVSCKNFLKAKLPETNEIRIITVLLISFILLLPWAIFHNYKHTGKLFPSNNKLIIYKGMDQNINSALGIALPLKEFQKNFPDQSKKWNEPWVYPDWFENSPSTKRYDYSAFSFVTSVIGEYIFKAPGKIFIWILLWIHLIIYLTGLSQVLKSKITKLCGFAILFSHIAQVFYLQNSLDEAGFLIPAAMDYRYISWNWLLWAVLYLSALSDKNKWFSLILKVVFILGILLQIYVLMTVTGSSWK